MKRYQRKIQVKDGRKFGYFTIADAFIDSGYMARLGATASAVYFAFCRHANDDDESWPSYQTIADETGIDRRHVIKVIQDILVPSGVIRKGKPVKYKSNMFFVTNQEDWKPLSALPMTKTIRSDKGVKNPNRRLKATRVAEKGSVSETPLQVVFQKHPDSVSETPPIVFQKHPKETQKKETQEPHTTPTPPQIEAVTTEQRGGRVVFASQGVSDPVIVVLAEALETTTQAVQDTVTATGVTLREFCHAVSYAISNKGSQKGKISLPLLWLRSRKAFDSQGAFVFHNGTRHLDLPELIRWLSALPAPERGQVDAFLQKKITNYTPETLSTLWMSHEFQTRAASLYKQWQKRSNS